MNPMKRGLRDQVLARDNNTCVRWKEGTCRGRMNTIEHVWGRKNEELWSCITLCAYHHGVDEYLGGGDLNKQINKFLAYQNITNEELRKYKLGSQMIQEKKFLEEKYAQVIPSTAPKNMEG